MGFEHSIIDRAVMAAINALPQRLSVREMAAANVSLWTLQKVFARTYNTTPVAHVQQLCLKRARRDLERGKPGDTVFAIARRWASPVPTVRSGTAIGRAMASRRPTH